MSDQNDDLVSEAIYARVDGQVVKIAETAPSSTSPASTSPASTSAHDPLPGEHLERVVPAASSDDMSSREPGTMPAEIWRRVSGIPHDETAGFSFWAASRKLGPRTSDEWRKVYTEFLAQPSR